MLIKEVAFETMTDSEGYRQDWLHTGAPMQPMEQSDQKESVGTNEVARISSTALLEPSLSLLSLCNAGSLSFSTPVVVWDVLLQRPRQRGRKLLMVHKLHMLIRALLNRHRHQFKLHLGTPSRSARTAS